MASGVPYQQNSHEDLRLLAAQKAMYSHAKRLFVWRSMLTVPLIVLLSLAVQFLNSQSSFYKVDLSWLLAFLSVVISLTEVFWLSRRESNLQLRAAKIQEMFDTEVLQLPWNSVCVGTPVAPELISKYATTHKAKKENPALLHDWYPVTLQALPDEVARLLCQRFNLWWDSDLRSRFSYFLLAVGVVLFAVLLIIGLASDLTVRTFVTNVLLPFVPFLYFALGQHHSNQDAVQNLDGLREHIETLWQQVVTSKTLPEGLDGESRRIQDRIFTNRKTSPLILDQLYYQSRGKQEKSMQDIAEGYVQEYRRRKP